MVQEQINDPMIFILFVAAAISMLLREFSDTGIILAVILLNTAVGVFQEGKAVKAMEALKKITAPEALVKRGEEYRKIPAAHLVKGDLVKVEAGDQVPADIRLLRVRGLSADESALTGESLPVQKTCLPLGPGLPAPEKRNMLFYVFPDHERQRRRDRYRNRNGYGTGEDRPYDQSGHRGAYASQKRLGDLGKILSITAVGFCLALFVLGLFQHRDMLQMLLLAISLAVAAIPEGLPAVVTIVLALGVGRMVKVNTIIRKLPAVETLGSVGVVCSDKTGTLTENT